MDSIAIAILSSYLIQFMKNSKSAVFAWITRDNPTLLRVLSVLAASLTAAGIAWNFSPLTGTLTISGLTYDGIAAFVWIALKQVALQDLTFRAGFKQFQPPKGDPAVDQTGDYKPLGSPTT